MKHSQNRGRRNTFRKGGSSPIDERSSRDPPSFDEHSERGDAAKHSKTDRYAILPDILFKCLCNKVFFFSCIVFFHVNRFDQFMVLNIKSFKL